MGPQESCFLGGHLIAFPPFVLCCSHTIPGRRKPAKGNVRGKMGRHGGAQITASPGLIYWPRLTAIISAILSLPTNGKK